MVRLAGYLTGCLAFAVMLLISGCSSSPELVTDLPQTSSFAPGAVSAYQLRSGDRLKLLVFGQDSISGDYTVDANGIIDVAQVGQVQAQGLTVEQLQQQLAHKLAGGIVENPQVSVLLDVNSPVFITGAVQSPGEYPFRPGLNSASVVALAGGYQALADTRSIYVKRAGSGTEQRYGIYDPLVINPGDVIRIPSRG